jgi:hypothetical protein
VIKDFLSGLAEAATSTLALGAYVVVVAAWAYKVWQTHRIESQAEKILEQFDTDAARKEALEKFLNASPPQGLPRKDLMRWVVLQSRHRSRVLAIVAYGFTLIAAIIIIGMAMFHPAEHETRKPPVLVDSEVQR